jgi:purine-binding chemotaxis protein CheW
MKGEASAGGGTSNLVEFRVGDVRYGIDVYRVREVVSPLPLSRLPHLPPVVIGVADHRGEVVPVIDLRLRFGLSDPLPTRTERWIIVRGGRRTAALVVDEVSEVFATDTALRREVPVVVPGADTRWIATVYHHRDTLVFVIETDRVTAVADELDAAALRALLP